MNETVERPLCVDMDGTLLRTDVLHEALWQYLRVNPFRIFLVLLWISKGRSVLKDEIFSRVALDVSSLPINEWLIDFLKREKSRGRLLVLATASPAVIAQQVARRVDFFDEILATDRELNLKGKNKAKALVERFGLHSFDYVGDSKADLHVWEKSHTAHVVGNISIVGLPRQVTRGQEFPIATSSIFKEFLRCIRVHQWVKNLLIFVPPVMAHNILDPKVAMSAIDAFISFSFTASAVYVLNDLVDLTSDRKHKVKSKRPFASGGLPIWLGVILIPVLLGSAAMFTPMGQGFLSVLIGYFILTTLYSFYLKQQVLLDIFTLASLYTIRIFAGGVATATDVSPWLMAFSVFIFLSLACVKRASELFNAKQSQNPDGAIAGRGYFVSDFDQVCRFGSSAGYLAVLVLALYINSPEVTKFYPDFVILWLMCPLMLYWISRVWLLTARGQIHEDPIVFALKDRVSYVVAALCLTIFLFAL